jgi:hypothetical protein
LDVFVDEVPDLDVAWVRAREIILLIHRSSVLAPKQDKSVYYVAQLLLPRREVSFNLKGQNQIEEGPISETMDDLVGCETKPRVHVRVVLPHSD